MYFFFSISQVPIVFFSRSTKLVIIERLLLLAERYVITIEVIPIPFTPLSVRYHGINPHTLEDLHLNLYPLYLKKIIQSI